MLLPGILKGDGKEVLNGFAQQRLIQTALAVEKYRKTQNRLPGSLAELRQDSYQKIPTDPLTMKQSGIGLKAWDMYLSVRPRLHQ